MKKTLCILLIAAAVLSLACVVSAEEIPAGVKKFEGDWALGGGLVRIVWEEEGCRVLVDLCDLEGRSGSIREYACYYHEDTDTLVSFSSSRRSYTLNEVGERVDGEVSYDGVDEAGQNAVFAIAENGALVWSDDRDPDAGADLEFRYIGQFEGMWRSAEGQQPVWAEFTWHGLDQETFFYFVYLHRGDDVTYTDYTMTGVYDEAAGKLVCTGNVAGGEGGEPYEAVFSMTDDGRVLYEADGGVVLEYDVLGGSNG